MSEQLMDAQVHAAAAEPADDLVEQIRRLGELRDRGLLSAEQYLQRRAQILRHYR